MMLAKEYLMHIRSSIKVSRVLDFDGSGAEYSSQRPVAMGSRPSGRCVRNLPWVP